MVIFSFLISLFTLERFLSMHDLVENLPAYFKKALINPIYPNLDILV